MRLAAVRCVALATALLAASAASAQGTSATNITSTNVGGGTPQSTSTSQTNAQAIEASSAAYWGISVEDYRRYQSLMRGVRGTFSPSTISPIEVLGIHARNDAERRKYAEAFARLAKEDAERIIVFQAAYDDAMRRLYPNLMAIDLGANAPKPAGVRESLQRAPAVPGGGTRLPTPTAPTAAPAPSRVSLSSPTVATPAPVASGDKLIVFSAAGCTQCDATVRRSLAHVPQGVAIDLYVVGATTDADVQNYARTLQLDPSLVNSGKVTLNLDNGLMRRVVREPGASAPQVVRKRGEAVALLSPGEI